MAKNGAMKPDHQIITDIVHEGAHVLDLGCGNGELLSLLRQHKNALVQGIELDEEQMHICVENGLTVLQGDIESFRGIFGKRNAQRIIPMEKTRESVPCFIDNAPGIDGTAVTGASGIGAGISLISNHRRKHRIRFRK